MRWPHRSLYIFSADLQYFSVFAAPPHVTSSRTSSLWCARITITAAQTWTSLPPLILHPTGGFQRPLVIDRMGICTEQAIKIRTLVKAAGVLPAGGGGGGGGAPAASTPSGGYDGGPGLDTRACEKLRAAREHARLMEQHSEILTLSLRLGCCG